MKANRLFILLLLLCSCQTPSVDTPGTDTGQQPDNEFIEIPGGEQVFSIEAVNCRRVARVIGKSAEDLPNPNDTPKRFGMASTDFGNMWDTGENSVFCIFGDNFNSYGGDWLSNAIAVSTDRNMEDGLYYDSMLWDDSLKKRKEIIHRNEGEEVTCIPTAGFSLPVEGGHRQYVNYMSIRQWALGGDNDSWAVNYSEIVYSDDMGNTWTKSGVKWDSDSKFAQVAYVVQEDTVYMWGTPSGRHGNVYLSKVSSEKVLDKSAYKYWNGGQWVGDELEAKPVANGEVSEMTVRYNTYYKRYIMMYFSAHQRKLVYRDSKRPEGEWSCEKIILDGTYGPSIHPWFCDGRDLWFVSSTVTSNPGKSYDTWHIFLFNAKLRADSAGFNMVWEGGFENDVDKSINYQTLWNAANASTSHDSHSGLVSCKLVNKTPDTWKDACVQSVVVHKNTDYILTGYAKSSLEGSRNAYLGVRLKDGRIIDDNPALSNQEWRPISIEFNSGDNTELDVFFGAWGEEDLYVLVDDIQMTPN